ncbi:uncharacterized protein LOC132666770 isoform X2 [Panthera onca]
MAGAGGPQRLRDWLVAQIESGRYAGLRWEDAGKTLFRIPWKHAAQQGYQAQQDAALFRAWAIHKGRHLEGIDKEDPPTWKTRLRCALNKSADFCEVRERSQLDISDPYKVYRIVSGSAHGPVARTCAPPGKKNILRSRQEPPGDVTELVAHRTDQASCPASPCSLASSVTSALGALWHCRLSCPLLQLLPRHHPLSLLPARPLLTSTPPLVPPSAPPAPSLRLQRLRLRRRLHPPCFLPIHPSPLSSLSLLSPSPSPLSPPLSPLSPHLCHFCPHVYHLCPHLYLLCPLISATSVPMSITSIPTSVTSVPSSLPPLSPCLSPLSPPLSPLSPHLCHFCPHVYHLCPHLYLLCPLISATSVPMSITSIPTSVTSVPSSLPPLSPCLSPLSPPLSPLSPHLCHLCPHVYHLCPHLCHLCPHLYHVCPLISATSVPISIMSVL